MRGVNIGKAVLRGITVGAFENNVYFLIDPLAGESVIIDAAAEAERILEAVRGTRVKFILQTHCHMDHVLALKETRSRTGAPVGVHPADQQAFGVSADIHLKDGQTLDLGQETIRVLHTPGHTPGGLCFLIGGHLISGDTLFKGGPGKTAGPEQFRQILESITKKIYCLPDETVCLPGHGPETTVGESKREYEVFARRKRTEPVYGDVVWLAS
ncbi:MAG: MBL fold metallo-hydrolase [Deltaproteobacteria bacterium]|nr:MBL fold metallo-hydrolase [Deltaproteobacteria bacterium]